MMAVLVIVQVFVRLWRVRVVVLVLFTEHQEDGQRQDERGGELFQAKRFAQQEYGKKYSPERRAGEGELAAGSA